MTKRFFFFWPSQFKGSLLSRVIAGIVDNLPVQIRIEASSEIVGDGIDHYIKDGCCKDSVSSDWW